ncbi:protein of unknown function [Chryseobacterium sp. JV274]|nr:protein of unknown function [Chryseobacterium sp. JV274]
MIILFSFLKIVKHSDYPKRFSANLLKWDFFYSEDPLKKYFVKLLFTY